MPGVPLTLTNPAKAVPSGESRGWETNGTLAKSAIGIGSASLGGAVVGATAGA